LVIFKKELDFFEQKKNALKN